MNFQEFRRELFDSICFTTNQVYAWQSGFDKNNLGRWVKKGFLIKLRNGYYSFPEYLGKADFAWYIANRMYKPSYVSLHTALAFYGMIPESVVQITSVTPLKTNSFINSFGTYSYKTIDPGFFFGYDAKPMTDGRVMLLATPEKALIDLLYLYPFYREPGDFEELRLDADFLTEHLNPELIRDYLVRAGNQALVKRMLTLQKTYGV
jgi:predicted transcriptional regulator of viral defense system